MRQSKESQVLAAARKADPKKKRVTFFLTEHAKSALASWCEEHGIAESRAVEEMIRATVPGRFFREEK